jgi:hypothetical protein
MLNTITGLLSGGAPAGGDYESIATINVTSGVTDLTFTSIPSTYTHLQVRLIGQTNRGTFGRDALIYRFNLDTTTSYSLHAVYGDGSSVGSGAITSSSSISTPELLTSTSGANNYGPCVIDILDYANTNKYKTTRALGGGDHNGTVAGLGSQVQLNSGLWQSTAAINSIRFYPAIGSNITAGSSFALYGIK